MQPARDIVNSLEMTEQTLTDLLAIYYELGYHDIALGLLDKSKEYKSYDLMKWKGYN